MIEILIAMVGIIILVYLVSTADIKITIIHKAETSEAPTVPVPTKDIDKMQETLDTERENDPPPTFDDIVYEVQKILGGDDDE